MASAPSQKDLREQWKASLIPPIFGILVGLLTIRFFPHPGAFLWGGIGIFSVILLVKRLRNRPR